MNPNLDKLYTEQQARIQILERENDFLSQKVEENQLLSKTFEEINAYEKSEKLFDNILESISILLDIQYSGIFEQRNKQFVNIAGYSLFDSTDSNIAIFEIAEKIQKKLFSCQSYFLENNNDYHFYYPNSNFVSTELLIVPLCAKPVVNKIFVFANNKNGILYKNTTLLEKIAKISSLKLEQIYYQTELENLNTELEKRVENRTQELLSLNKKLLTEIEEKNKAELELKKSEAKFKAIFEHSPLGLFYYNNKGVILNCNNNFVDIIGSSKEALIGLDMINSLPDKKLVNALKKSLVVGTGIYRGYYKSLTGAKVTPVRVVFGGIKNKNKEITSGIGIVEDITKQKQAEDEIIATNEELRATTDALIASNDDLTIALEKVVVSENKFKQLSNLTFEGIVIHKNGIVHDVNLSFIKMVGYKREEIIGENIIELLVLKKDWEKVIKNISKNTTLPYEVEGKRKDGSIFTVEIQAKDIPDNDKNMRVAAIRDISSRKKIETQIKKLSTAVEQSANTIVITDTKGNIEYVNPKFTKITGYTASEAIGQNPRILNTGKQTKEYYAAMWTKISAGQTWAGEFYNKKKNGAFFWEQVTITPIKNETGNIVNYLAIKEDITARKKAENELIIAKEKAEESDRLKTEFLNNMSHEIRTPLNGILGFSKLLNIPDLTYQKQQNYLKIIISSSTQLMRIIEDILEISRLGTKQVKVRNEVVCLNDLLQELLLIFNVKAKEKKLPFYLKNALSDKESIILTDKSKLNKILDSLLENALKFTILGSVEFGYTVFEKNKEMFLQLYVKDTGIGITQENHELIFKRFAQVEKEMSQKMGGLGLGLSIAKENTELLGGEITLKSEKGKGTVFLVTIPYKPAK